MSSILSGDAANSQHKLRTTTATSSDLTFAGRFKSVSQLDNLSHDNSTVLANGLKTICRTNDAISVDQPNRQTYDEYINNNSSTSCSRLSPFEEQEAKQSRPQSHSKSFVEPNKHQIPTLLSFKPHETHSSEYHENLGSQMPKKRGRKKARKVLIQLLLSLASRNKFYLDLVSRKSRPQKNFSMKYRDEN